MVAAVWKMVLFSTLVAILLNLAIIRVAGPAYDMRPISTRLKQLEDAGVPLAHEGGYPGTFNFIGRLKQSPEISSHMQLSQWFAEHPDGRAIVYFNEKYPLDATRPEFLQHYLGEQVGILNRQQWDSWCAAHRQIPGAC